MKRRSWFSGPIRWAVRAVVWLTAESFAVSAGACPLDPSVLALKPLCEAGEISAEACAWYPFLEAVAEGRIDDARGELVSEAGLSKEGSGQVTDVLVVLLLLGIAPDCENEDLFRQFGEAIPGLLKVSEEPLGVLTMWSLVAFDGEAMARIGAAHQHIPDVPALLKGLKGLRELLDRAGILEKLRRQSPSVADLMAPGRSLDLSFDQPSRFAPLLQQIDMIVLRSGEETLEVARRELQELASSLDTPLEKGVVWSRAGAGFITLGRAEDATSCFARAEKALESVGSAFGKTLKQLGRVFQIAALESLSAHEQANRVRELKSEIDLPDLFSNLTSVGSAEMVEGLGSLLLDLSSGVTFPNAEAIKEAGAVLWSPLKGDKSSEPPHSSSDRRLFDSFNQILTGEEEAALKDFKEMTEKSPHFVQVLKGVFIGLPKVKQKDFLGYLETLDPILSLVERELKVQRIPALNRFFFDSFGQSPFFVAATVAAWAGKMERSFNYSERGRSFSMRRTLGSAREPWEPKALSDAERRLEAEIVSNRKKGFSEEMKSLQRDFAVERLKRQLLTVSPKNPEVTPVAEARELQELLMPDEALVSVYFGFQESLAWVISREDIQMVRNKWSEKDGGALTCWISKLRWNRVPEGIRSRSAARGFEILDECSAETEMTPEQALFKLLIEPLGKALPADGRLIFVPHGPLHGVPFAALQAPDGRSLIDDYEISVVPSADAFRKLRSRPGSDEIALEPLVLGGPITHLSPLPAAKNEARVAANLLGVTPRLCSQATEASLYDQASRASLLHVAAHGVYEPDAPLFSRLQLTPGGGEDGFLHVYEIWDRLDLSRSRLVVLSACDTAAGEPTGGDDIVGLTQAFLVAGAPAVISTLWPVDDRASALLMEAFYRRFLGGEAAGAALRGAQLELQSRREYSAPYFWAGYQLVGDPETRWQAAQVDEEPN